MSNRLRKIKQIAVTSRGNPEQGGDHSLIALCNDGTLWCIDDDVDKEWREIPLMPDIEE